MYPFQNKVKAGYAEVGETVEIQAPPNHELGGGLEFTYYKDGSMFLELSFDHDARIEAMEIGDRVLHVQIADRYS